MSGHSTWHEWIYIGVVIALLVWVGAEAWNIERLVEHVPEEAKVIIEDSEIRGRYFHDRPLAFDYLARWA